MKSLFSSAESNELINRIQKLNPETKSVWGKMTVAQMLVHAQKPFKVAAGEIILKRGLISFLIGGIARKTLTGPKPFQKNLPTDKNFIVTDHPSFDTEKNNLIAHVKRFTIKGEAAITDKPHPFFGKMSVKQWDALMYKHLDHHLRQFGA